MANPRPSPLNCGLGPFTWWLPSLQLFQLFAHSPVPQDIHWGCWTGWINSKSLCTGYGLLDCHHGLGPWLPSFSPMQKYFYIILLCHKVLGLATTFPSIFGAHLKTIKQPVAKTYTLGTDFEKLPKTESPWPRPLYSKKWCLTCLHFTFPSIFGPHLKKT